MNFEMNENELKNIHNASCWPVSCASRGRSGYLTTRLCKRVPRPFAPLAWTTTTPGKQVNANEAPD